MSKYANGVFFSTSYATISPPSTSFDMARSNSRDSTMSTSHFYPTSHPMSQCSSAAYSIRYQPTSVSMRRTSSSSSSQSSWSASPYRSCLNRSASCEEATSYLSDDDLLNLSIPVESIPNPCIKKTELSTEEQIARLREQQQAEEQRQRRDSGYQSHSASRRKTVRFEPEVQRKPQCPSKGKSPAYRKQLRTLNGPM